MLHFCSFLFTFIGTLLGVTKEEKCNNTRHNQFVSIMSAVMESLTLEKAIQVKLKC